MIALPDRLLVVTDRHQARAPLPSLIAAALAGGARWIWLRERNLEPGARGELAAELSRLTARAGATLSIGGDVELAARVGAGGVHLQSVEAVAAARAHLGPAALIGVSAHGHADVLAATTARADYVTLSPIFATPSKPGYGPALGLDALRNAASLGLPLLALGGIETGSVRACLAMGAAGVAVMGEIMRAADGAASLRRFRACLRSAPPGFDDCA